MQAILISRRFNPGHLSHLLANAKLLVEAGYEVKLRVHPASWEMAAREMALPIRPVHWWQMVGLSKDNLVIVWFPSVAAVLDMVLVRLFSRATVVYVFHEPFTSLKSYRSAGFGLGKTLRIALVSLVNYALVGCSHKIILPSTAAVGAFRERYSAGKECARIPLLFDDEAVEVLPCEQREYTSYIGTIAEDHAFDEFVRFAVRVLSEGGIAGCKMLIATRSELPSDAIERLQPFVEQGTIVIQQGRPLSNAEINYFYSKSVVVWNAYRRSMQSGVLPKAYMFGTPVLVSEHNRNEFFVAGLTGCAIAGSYDFDDIRRAVCMIEGEFERYSTACRRAFLETFYYKASSGRFLEFVQPKNREEA